MKSALFGTPAPLDDTVYDIGTDLERRASTDSRRPQSTSMSPTKPQGILLTPGTATSRRKTVSFGTEVVDKIPIDKMLVDEGMKERGSKSPSIARMDRKTSLTKTLENARDGKAGKPGLERTRRPSESQPLLDLGSEPEDINLAASRKVNRWSQDNKDAIQSTVDDIDGDMTMDLNLPHSQSGKYWKTEYEQYHEEAKAELTRLLKYKHLAKSYAKKKDAEAIELAEKLRVEQQRVVNMEEKISRLSGQITSTCIDGKYGDSPELIKELARQTALAVQYRAQVEEFRAAVEGNEELGDGMVRSHLASPRTTQTLLETQHELKKARGQLIELSDLREEMARLRKTLSTAEKNNLTLRDENTKLTQDLLHADYRLEKQIEKSEKRRSSSEDLIRRKDEAFRALQKDYDTIKELAKSQRRDAEQLLRKRHDQVVALKKELASLKGAETTVKELQAAIAVKDSECDQVNAGYLKEIEQLKQRSTQRLEDTRNKEDSKSKDMGKRGDKPPKEIHALDGIIPVSSPALSRPSKSMPPRHSRSDTPVGSPKPKYRSSQPVLSEINNNASSDRLAFRKSDLVQFTPLTDRFTNLSLEEPELQLPESDASLPHIPSRAIHDRNRAISPRPSMFNIASSPPKPVMIRSRDDEPSRQRTNGILARKREKYVASTLQSSLESSRVRGDLPPERAAAAKARLEKKNAEKKRAQAMAMDKENI